MSFRQTFTAFEGGPPAEVHLNTTALTTKWTSPLKDHPVDLAGGPQSARSTARTADASEIFLDRCRANSAQIIQSRPDYVLGLSHFLDNSL